jgi:Phosphotransferase enzyme family
MPNPSIAVPDSALHIVPICEEQLGSLPASPPERLGAGRNSRVFRVALEDKRVVLFKFYRHDAGDIRDRLATEFNAVRFMWENGVRAIPCAIANDRTRFCAIYEYIDGEPPAAVAEADVDALVDFLSSLQPLRGKAAGSAIGVASEASFSLAAVEQHVQARADRLRDQAAETPALRQWFDESFDPLWSDVATWYRSEAALAGRPVDLEIEADRRTLSPSDFGFHNAIRRQDGSLAFVDFEYFGWDDPAKTVVDFLLHPGMTLPETLTKRFAERFLRAFAFVPGLADRARLVYPLFGLKWCLILLNDFLPDRETTATWDVRTAQLRRAGALVDRIRAEYRANPFLA